MKYLLLTLLLTSCASYQTQTLEEQNQEAVGVMYPESYGNLR